MKRAYELLMEELEQQYKSVEVNVRGLLNLAMIERMMPVLRAFAVETRRDISLWEAAVEVLWKAAEGDRDSSGTAKLCEECIAAVPEDGQTESDYETFAQNTVINIYEALAHLLDHDPEHSIQISSNIYDTVDGYAQLDLYDVPDLAGKASQIDEASIADHPIVKQEVRRQLSDLNRLRCTPNFTEDAIREMRSQWRSDQRQVFVLELG